MESDHGTWRAISKKNILIRNKSRDEKVMKSASPEEGEIIVWRFLQQKTWAELMQIQKKSSA